MEQLFDLPAHPLLVHAPIVLIPLLAIACTVVASRPGLRRHTPWVVGGGVVTFVSLWLATQSGEALDEAFRRDPSREVDIRKHESLADTTQVLLLVAVIVLLVLAVLWWRKYRSAARISRNEQIAMNVAWAVCTALAWFAVVWAIRTGHEGARLVWEGQLK